MKISRIAVTAATVVALATTSALGSAGAFSPAAGSPAQTATAAAAEPDASPGRGDDRAGDDTFVKAPKYKVRPGVTFNHPGRGGKKAYAILDKIKAAIRHTRKGARIRVMSWNFASSGIAQTLVQAHRRGVSVRFIMARSLASGSGSFKQLTAGLKKGNKKRPPALRSFTRTCDHSCRGGGGAMHSKFMTISKTGSSERVVMQGSSNFTTTAADNQWNDWFTTVGNKTVYAKYMREFNLSVKDRNSGLRDFRADDITGWFAPRKSQPDLVRQMLDKTSCKGGTFIRIASAVWQNDRGKAIGRRVKQLHRQGCNIRIVFTMMTQEIRNITAGVPKRHLVYDYNGDGAFDRYLHMKAMAINGTYAGKRNNHVVFNGSANWSTLGQISDEQGMIIRRKNITNQYTRWINGLYDDAPRGYRPLPKGPTENGNPYADLELELF